MKISKSLLTLIVASAGTIAITASCDKEDIRPNGETDKVKCEYPGEKGNGNDVCHACGMG